MIFVNDGWTRSAMNPDKISHAGGCCIAVCLLWAIVKQWSLLNTTSGFFSVIVMVLVGGIALELWQGFYGHGFSWRDLVADAVGILIAYGAINA